MDKQQMDKLKALEIYKHLIQEKLYNERVPKKHEKRPQSYIRFLENELKVVNNSIIRLESI